MFTHSPFSPADVSSNELTVRNMISQHELTLPPNPHFVTHLNEFSVEAMHNLCAAFVGAGCPDGVHTFSLRDDALARQRRTIAVTRLNGTKVGNASLENTPRVLVERGAGRPPQPVVVDPTPFRSTDLGTVICFGGCVYTIHSGPSMPESFDDPEWTTSALCYRADEV